MSDPSNSETAVQYLIWALEELEKLDQPKAVRYVRMALDELNGARLRLPNQFGQETRLFRDRADGADQFAESAATDARRETLGRMAESYRRTANKMDMLSTAQQTTNKDKGGRSRP